MKRSRFDPSVEWLECRRLLTVNLSDAEQLMLELINRARLDPQGEVDRTLAVVSLNDGVADEDKIDSGPKQPLAPNQSLIDAARLHAQDMLDRDFFNHVNPDGEDPSDRASAAGYPGGAGENIGWKGSSGNMTPQERIDFIYDMHESLFISVGHRLNIMNENYRELGVGIRYGEFFHERTHYDAVMGAQSYSLQRGDRFITGVAFDDLQITDDFYSIGEGLGGIEITATRNSDQLAISTTTGPSGGYALQAPDGTYVIEAKGGGLESPIIYSNVVVDGQNVKVDFNTRSIVADEISGFVFGDIDGNGLQSVGETGLGEMVLFLDTDGDSVRDASETFVSTDDRGNFAFTHLLPGDYRAVLELPTRWVDTSQYQGVLEVTLIGDASSSGHRFAAHFPNSIPLAEDDAFRVEQGIETSLDVLANDVDLDGNLDWSSWELVTAPSRGLVAIDHGTSQVRYTPQPTFVGTDEFVYRVRDQRGAPSVSATVILDVRRSEVTPYQNGDNIYDVDQSGSVSPLDARLVLDEINARTARQLPAVHADATIRFVDTNGDGFVSGIDVLSVLTAISRSVAMRDPIVQQRSVVGGVLSERCKEVEPVPHDVKVGSVQQDVRETSDPTLVTLDWRQRVAVASLMDRFWCAYSDRSKDLADRHDW